MILLPFLFFVVVIGIIIVVAVVAHQKEKERTQQMQAVAAHLGWAFAPNPPLAMIPNFNHFSLFSYGHSKNIKNMMYGEANGVKAAVFDYVYVTGSGKHRHTHHHSVVYLEPQQLRIPYFSLRPEGFMHKLISAFGYQDIDFTHRPDFSKNYLLRGQDEQAIRMMFHDNLLSFYEVNQGVCTEGGGNQLLIYRENFRVQPQDVQQYVGWGLGVMNLFPRSW
jgi:hypothetical protein